MILLRAAALLRHPNNFSVLTFKRSNAAVNSFTSIRKIQANQLRRLIMYTDNESQETQKASFDAVSSSESQPQQSQQSQTSGQSRKSRKPKQPQANQLKERKEPKPKGEDLLLVSTSEITTAPYVDTHCHLSLTLSFLAEKTQNQYNVFTVQSLRDAFFPSNLDAVVDVICVQQTVPPIWRELIQHDWIYLASGCHPHDARLYTDETEQQLMEMHMHPKVLAWGEMGLDYHYNNSPPAVQKEVLVRQLKRAVEMEKPLVIHTREADEDIYEILVANVPKETRIHVHCFTDSPKLAEKLLAYFPNLYIGITGVVTFSSNANTTDVIRNVAPLERLLLETDSPFMVPKNLYRNKSSKHRVSLSHSGMIPYVAQWIAELKNINVNIVMEQMRRNTKAMYGI